MTKERKRLKPLRKAETSWSVDPLSDLVSAQELRAWRRDPTTDKVLRYLSRWRHQLVEAIAEGATTAPSAETTAMLTTEAVSKATLLKDILELAAPDIAAFYGLDEPQEKAK